MYQNLLVLLWVFIHVFTGWTACAGSAYCYSGLVSGAGQRFADWSCAAAGRRLQSAASGHTLHSRPQMLRSS